MKDDGKSQTVSYTEFEYRAIADKYRKAYKALLK